MEGEQQEHDQRREPEWDGVLLTSESVIPEMVRLGQGLGAMGQDMGHIGGSEVVVGSASHVSWNVCLCVYLR